MSEQIIDTTPRGSVPLRSTTRDELLANWSIINRDDVFAGKESTLKSVSEAICSILNVDLISVMSDARSYRALQELSYLMLDIIDNSDNFVIQTLAASQKTAAEMGSDFEADSYLTERSQLAFFVNNMLMRRDNAEAGDEFVWFTANADALGEFTHLLIDLVELIQFPQGTVERPQVALATAGLIRNIAHSANLQVPLVNTTAIPSNMGEYVAPATGEIAATTTVQGEQYRLYANVAPRIDSSISTLSKAFNFNLGSVVRTFRAAGEMEVVEPAESAEVKGIERYQQQPERIKRVKAVIKDTINNLNASLKMILALAEPQEAKLIRAKFLTEWAKQVLPQTKQFVLDIVKLENVERLRIGATSGPQGTGKGTNFTAIQKASEVFYGAFQNIDWAGGSVVPLPESISNYALSYLDNSATVITGTGGMFYMPKDDYVDMFGKTEQFPGMDGLTSAWTSIGELVPPEFTSVFSELMTALRIVEGARSIQYDLWPRSQEQMDHQQELVDGLRGQGVAIAHELLDLRLLNEEEIATVQADREGFVRASESLGIAMKKKLTLFNQYLAELTARPEREYDQQFLVVERMANELKTELADDERAVLLMREIDRAMERMRGRNRTDDMPKTAFNRLASYEKDTQPSVLGTDMPMISTTRAPSEVAPDILIQSIMIEDGDQTANAVRAIYAEIAGQIAEIVVAVSGDRAIREQGEEAINAEIQNRIINLVQPNLDIRIKEALQTAA